MYQISQNLLLRTPLLSLLIICFSVIGCSKSSEKKSAKKTDAQNSLERQNQKQEIQIVDGRYISTEDSLAGIEIKNDTYIMFYRGYETDSSDHYKINITDTITIRDTTYRNGKYLTLKNERMTLKYAIDYWKQDYISLINLPRGNFLSYRRESKKKTIKNFSHLSFNLHAPPNKRLGARESFGLPNFCSTFCFRKNLSVHRLSAEPIWLQN